ncbi:hypothetical protein Tcan_00363 [Toxocara canis]|uniref:Uncharacterized protein n=1 Tax=Toxocara canis TaxID=6265 RepID=A0A0B2VIA4_TOXCA|nr:hypothetical protein Tcan_00363 [Toxocara canis]
MFEKYADYVLPRAPRDVSFPKPLNLLTSLFGPQQSLFNACYAGMKLAKEPREDFVTSAGRVDRECVNFLLGTCTEDQFGCLVYVCGLQSSDDAFVRLKLLDKIEADPTCTVQTLTEECESLLNLKHDTKMFENDSLPTHTVRAVQESRRRQRRSSKPTITNRQSQQQSNQPREYSKDAPNAMLVLRRDALQSRLQASTAPLLHVQENRAQGRILQRCQTSFKNQSPFKPRCVQQPDEHAQMQFSLS